MTNLTNSHSLTDFQRNARSYIENINETHEPMLLTVNGKVQAVLVDPATFQQREKELERARFVAAIREGELDIQAGRTWPAEEVFAELDAKYASTADMVRAKLRQWQKETNTVTSPAIPAGELFAQWAAEDVNMTDEEKEAEDRLWEDVQSGINETRAALGMRQL
jgi:PHD/YefM family antitoxin component YafN of YafNO toxin-antitoxin module